MTGIDYTLRRYAKASVGSADFLLRPEVVRSSPEHVGRIFWECSGIFRRRRMPVQREMVPEEETSRVPKQLITQSNF